MCYQITGISTLTRRHRWLNNFSYTPVDSSLFTHEHSALLLLLWHLTAPAVKLKWSSGGGKTDKFFTTPNGFTIIPSYQIQFLHPIRFVFSCFFFFFCCSVISVFVLVSNDRHIVILTDCRERGSRCAQSIIECSSTTCPYFLSLFALLPFSGPFVSHLIEAVGE